jgi:hypothetical protein
MRVASYCTTFLKPEMLHIYRQITGLRRWETVVVATLVHVMQGGAGLVTVMVVVPGTAAYTVEYIVAVIGTVACV